MAKPLAIAKLTCLLHTIKAGLGLNLGLYPCTNIGATGKPNVIQSARLHKYHRKALSTALHAAGKPESREQARESKDHERIHSMMVDSFRQGRPSVHMSC